MSADNLNWFDNVEHRPHPWPGLNWLTTAIACADVRRAFDFYAQALSFVAIFELPGENGELLFARMRYRGCNFTLNKIGWDFDGQPPADAGHAPPFQFYLYVDDVAATSARMKEQGAVEIFPPRTEMWGDLRSRLRDPFGYVWDLAQAPR
jgi:PhnB protein